MFNNPAIEKLGRRLRLAVVGGGADSLIGQVHRSAARLDDRYEVVAAVLSSDAKRSHQQGVHLGLQPERAYGTLSEMLQAEPQRPDPIEVVAIMTPNHSHYADCVQVLNSRLHILCDKPLTTTLKDARDLVQRVQAADVVFCLTHNYSGYPMIRQARAMVAAGEIGEVRQVNVEYSQGQLSSYVEPDAPARMQWRLDRARGGPSAVLGDIGSHTHQLLSYVTGLQITKLCADVGPTVPERDNDDYAGVLLRLQNGARGTLWITQSAAGSENVIRIKVFGSKGGLEWEHSQHNYLRHLVQAEPARILSRGLPGLSPAAKRATRTATGHPEGFQEAFANLYNDAAEAIVAKLTNTTPDPLALSFPSVVDGAMSMAFQESALHSSQSGGGWCSVPLQG